MSFSDTVHLMYARYREREEIAREARRKAREYAERERQAEEDAEVEEFLTRRNLTHPGGHPIL